MNQETKYQGVVIEATPEAETVEPVPGNSRVPLLLSLLIILAMGAALLFALPYWQKLQQDLGSLKQQIHNAATAQQELQSRLNQALELTRQHQTIMDRQGEVTEQQLRFMEDQQAAFNRQDQRIADATQNMARKELTLDHSIEEVRKLAGKPDSRWMVAEAEYLIQVAISRLNLAFDPATAARALQQAEQRLAATGEARWDPVREQLSRDRDELNSLTLPDLEPLSRQLDLLIAQIPQLRLRRSPLEPAESPRADEKEASPDPSWSTLLHDLAKGAQNTLRIRRNDQPVQPLIAPQQAAMLYQNLELMLGSARLALLQRENALFKESLQRADQWLASQFDPDDPATRSMQTTLTTLSETRLLPPLPDITRSLDYLRTQQALEQTPP